MASNEVEVLDPAPTVENLKKFASERVLNRRHFIAALGVAGAAAAGTELVRSGPTALAQQPKPSGYAQADVLNFLLNLKYLKATLYSYITQGTDLIPTTNNNVPDLNLGTGGVFNPPAKITFTAAGPASAQEITDLFGAMYYDELEDLVTLRSILGSAVANRATINLLGTGATTTTATQTVTPVQAISILRMLEDLSTAAFAGATIYLTGTNLQYATQALAVNGFHAGALRLLALQTGAPYYAPQDLTTASSGTQTQNSFTGNLVAGSTTIYNSTQTNPITVGSILTGPGVPPNTTITSVTPPPVYTGTLTGTTTAPNLIITNVSPTPPSALTGMVIAGTGIPANSIIANITGNTITIGAITGFSSQTPPTPILNGLTSVTGTTGTLMTLGNYPLVFTGGGSPTTTAQGSLTVLTSGTAATPGTYSIALTSYGAGYTSAPTVAVPALTVGTGGTLPVFTANIPAQITTSASGVTLTPGIIAATTKSSNVLSIVTPTSVLTPGQILSGTNLPSNSFIQQGGINASAGTVTIQQGAAVPLANANASATTSVAPTGLVTNGSPVITNVSSVSGILPGMPITGTNIKAGATVLYSDPNSLTITMSVAATGTSTAAGTSSVTPLAYLTSGSNIVTALSSLSGLAAGDTVTGTGIPSGTTVTAVGGINTMVLSQNATATTVTSAGGSATALLQSGNNIVSYVYQTTGTTTGFTTGQLIVDAQGNIPPGTTITGVTASTNTITLSAPATNATPVTTAVTFTATVVADYETLSSVSSFTGLVVGQPITGPNIPFGTVITALNSSASTLTISQFPTAALGAELVAASFSTLATTTLTSYKLPTITVVTPASTVPSQSVTIPTVETITPSLGTATLSQAPTASGITTVIVQGTDSQDVEPNDPGTITFAGFLTSGSSAVTSVSSLTGLAVGQLVSGPGIPAGTTIATITAPSSITLSASATASSATGTETTLAAYLANSAALAAGGPAAIAGTSPTVYGGFFDTASGSTSSANNPAGATFARTFSQVLAVLYGSTTPQTYQGGFFPNGVGGNINFV